MVIARIKPACRRIRSRPDSGIDATFNGVTPETTSRARNGRWHHGRTPSNRLEHSANFFQQSTRVPLALVHPAPIMNLMKTTAARFSETSSKVDGTFAVRITADTKADAQAAIRLAQAWVKSLGGVAKLTDFTVQPRWSSNLDQFYSARIAYRLPAAKVAA